ncbi:hypothetical protein [Sorangium cellulosum]|uniref:Uncharacterized protein n=1 Tax=Sorangium cellulosum TaxID=56 RepID=A0A150R3F8_SORCE|nr:hypothetical protein [Sorangium cellulosum]KYF74348.1 hypothetical protein BE15_06930 [Sorangium cellulosum]
MPSKRVTDRQKSASSVIATGETHADRVATEIKALLSPYLHKGEEMPNIALLAHLVARALADARERMVTADEALADELADDGSPREGRDEVAHELHDELTDLRDWLTSLYGAAALEQLGFAEATPHDPVQIERFAGEVTRALSSKELPKPRRAGVRWDADDAVLRIERRRDALVSHLKDAAREAREAEATRMAKSTAIALFDERFGRIATFLGGLFRLAGHADLANQVRPSSRRSGLTEADAPPEDPTSVAPARRGGSAAENE